MKIDITFNSKSIDNAIKTLKLAKVQLENQMLTDFLFTCCTWLYDNANTKIMFSSIGDSVKSNIMSGWEVPKIEKRGKRLVATLKNTDEQAVYVEFGVGIVGQENPHERATEEAYEYNIGKKINPVTHQWIFNVSNDSDIDIQAEYIDLRTENTVKTKGSPAVMYAFNAVVDLLHFGINPIWEETKLKYWG
jgi:hypothetical protein